MKKISESTSLIIRAVLPLFSIIALFLVLGNIALTKVIEIQTAIDTAKKDKIVLTDKLSLLKTISVTGARDSNAAITAFPDTSPALTAISQLKTLAASRGLVLTSIKSQSGLGDGSDLNNVYIGFKIYGPRNEVANFLLSIKTLAPLMVLSNIKLADTGGIYTGNVTVNSYWSALPTQLPESVEGFQELSTTDKETLATVETLTAPQFMELPPANTEGKDNPFSQ